MAGWFLCDREHFANPTETPAVWEIRLDTMGVAYPRLPDEVTVLIYDDIYKVLVGLDDPDIYEFKRDPWQPGHGSVIAKILLVAA